ncbi:MAG: NAD(P)H-dependent oxidoreductase subunit E [Candidatus Eisenbacteria bacterium]|nr:NAD(P)H-dependent oxidoreductase subunit E [Candidatus Eisenbacteria bacterium]
MSTNHKGAVRAICETYGNDRSRMMDIVRDVQAEFGCVDGEAMNAIASAVSGHRVEVESVVSFYSFLSNKPKGKVVIRLCDDIIDEMKGSGEVGDAFRKELGIDFGGTTPDGTISLEWTPCIGMCDQAPAALVNDTVVTDLTGDKARAMAKQLKADPNPAKLVKEFGDGNNAHDLVRAMVDNNIRQKGEVIFADMAPGSALEKALAMSPQEVIRDMKTSRLRGRGGAGFPTGLKWEFTRNAPGDKRYVLCNADEGEPGTFKDRVILTEKPELLIEGIAIAGYAIGSDTGIIYLRGEYAYLRPFLESKLSEMRDKKLLGKNILGKGFDFDIRIQMGAGAYVCGEETALISSLEGLRGDPKNRPPFPAQKGYMAQPTVVNNVETLCCVARILEKGPGWFANMGSKGSPGTKLLSISGDVRRPGVYEVPFGIGIKEMLKLCGAEDASAAQIGGASGTMVSPDGFGRTICYDDVATGGAVMVFGPQRDILDVATKFLDFFIEESCGYCTPCRVGNVLLKERMEKILAGKGEPSDLEYLRDLGETIKAASRCGLGQTSANPVLTTLANFRDAYTGRLKEAVDGKQPSFDIQAALSDSKTITGRASVHFTE